MSLKIRLDKKDMIFAGAIALVHVLFFLLACRYTRIYMGDSFEYIYEARNIKHLSFFYSGNPVLPIEPEYMTQRQPLYPLLLFGVYLFTVNNWVVLVLQNILSVVNICYARRMFQHMGLSKRYDWVLLLFIIAYPAQFINANTIAPDILLQTFTLLYFGSFLYFVKARRLKGAVWMSLALIGGMMVKPVLYPFVVVHVVIVIATAAYLRIKLQRPAAIAIFPLCAVLLYSYWNYTRTEKFHFTSNQSFNAIYYFYPFMRHEYGADSANAFLAQERATYNSIQEYKDRYDYANAEGSKLLSDHLAPYVLFHLKSSARIFIEPGKAEMDLFTGKLTYGQLYSKQETGFAATWKRDGWQGMGNYFRHNPSMFWVMVVFLFNCAKLPGLWWFFRQGRVLWPVRLYVFTLIAYFAIAAGPIANTRYFLPVSLIVSCCAVMGYALRRNAQPATA